MADTDKGAKWMEAATKEVASLEKSGTWVEVDFDDAKTKVLSGTWVFKRKRSPDGEITKYKALYCVHGELEEGEPETFAPVAAWSSVRLFLVLSMTLNWDTCSIDFSNAFIQARLTDPVWIHSTQIQNRASRRSAQVSQVGEERLWLVGCSSVLVRTCP